MDSTIESRSRSSSFRMWVAYGSRAAASGAHNAASSARDANAPGVYSSPDEAPHAPARLLTPPGRPPAVIYDNDIMAVAGLSVAQEMGLDGQLQHASYMQSWIRMCRRDERAIFQ